MRCVICGAPAEPTQSTRHFELNRCTSCGHISATGVAADALEAIYEDDYAGHFDDPVFAANIRRELHERFLPFHPAGSRLLDVGCGNGAFLKAAVEAGYDAHGIDISHSGIELCRQQGLSASVQRLEDHRGTYDVVTMWDVVEHLPDPTGFVQQAHRLVRLGGHLVVKTPHITRAGFLLARIPSLTDGLLQVPGHVQFYTVASLTELLQRAGFGRVHVERIGDLRGHHATGSLARRARRFARRRVMQLAGNGNLYAFASVTRPARS